MSIHDFELRLEERLRRKAFAHYDCHSMTVDFGCPSKYKVLQERRNTVTGASAASVTPPLPDDGDIARQNDLVLACPYFRNEIGGEEERIICLNKLTDRRTPNGNADELHKPAFTSGITILENSSQAYKSICPYQKNFLLCPLIDYADTGAIYYRKFFYGKEHQNWFGKSEDYGPLAISIRKEQSHKRPNKHQYRIILRTSELHVLRGSIYEDCIPNQRTSSKDVLEHLLAKSDICLSKLRLGIPKAEEELLKLDEHKLTKNYKVGVLYCKAGQSTEEEFYNNQHSGPLFTEFLQCLGEKVRLKGFEKFKGGLDTKSDSTGLYSIHANYLDCEIMFHVSTMLPYSENNRQQLSRKRHIGNDIVTIVFQEEGALPFTPKTIRSQFQHVFIIVRALNTNLNQRRYAVAVTRSQEMPLFGPKIPEEGVFLKSPQFTNFMLAKIINAENAARKYCEKFRTIDQRTRLGLLTDLLDYTSDDVASDSNSGASGAVKIVSSLFGKKRSQRRYANFCGHSDIRGTIVWDVQVKDFGQSNKIIDCVLGISIHYLVIIENKTKDVLYVSPVEAVLGWTSNPAWIKIFGHQAECLLVQTKDPDVDEICEIVKRLKAVTNGCETRELTLRRTFLNPPQHSLGFDIQPDGIVTRVDPGSIAWQTHLQPGSRLVEICKTAVAGLSFPQMMEYIKTSKVVTLTVLPPNDDGSSRRGCLGATCAHQPVVSRPSSTFSSSSTNTHYSEPQRRIPATSLMTLV